MLQQTQVATVIGRLLRALAGALPRRRRAGRGATRRRCCSVWEGLGYYSRARNLQSAARAMVERARRRVPRRPGGIARAARRRPLHGGRGRLLRLRPRGADRRRQHRPRVGAAVRLPRTDRFHRRHAASCGTWAAELVPEGGGRAWNSGADGARANGVQSEVRRLRPLPCGGVVLGERTAGLARKETTGRDHRSRRTCAGRGSRWRDLARTRDRQAAQRTVETAGPRGRRVGRSNQLGETQVPGITRYRVTCTFTKPTRLNRVTANAGSFSKRS